MTITFFIRYHSKPGQELLINGNIPALGNAEVASAVQMKWFDNESWLFTLELPEGFDDPIAYKYIVRESDGTLVFDGEDDRAIDVKELPGNEIRVIDSWNADSNVDNVFFSRPFSEVLLDPVPKLKGRQAKSFTHEFRVKAPLLGPGEIVCFAGSSKPFGYWATENPILMRPSHNWFVARLSLEPEGLPVTYKYGIYNLNERKFVRFEDGENRLLHPARKNEVTILHDGFVRTPAFKTWKGAGVSIPVFSLRTEKSFGVGEFSDLLLLIDWAKKVGMKLIQILPVNDTTATHKWMDSYPYAAISAFALHPIYLNLEKVAGKEHAEFIKPLKKKRKQLNELLQFDYEQVMKTKLNTLREIYEASFKDFRNDPIFFEFFDLNREWLVPYAVFSYLRDKNKTADFTKWKSHKTFDEAAIQKYASPGKKHYKDISFFYFLQYHLHRQMQEVISHAHRNQIILKGDIPIGIYRYGCDAWANPSLYNMDEQAGAPPDDFAVTGQNWGFPTYNWDVMNRNGFRWWRKRFDQMSKYFDAFRIDHILGFFRIWSIPIEQIEGIMGRFVPAVPVDISEFTYRDIWFDYHRYCNPFITDEILWSTIPDGAEFIIDKCLEAGVNGWYLVKENFNTQRKVSAYFDAHKVPHGDAIKNALISLLSNVILIEEKSSGKKKFHFRFGMENTSSFQQLEYSTRQKLKDLYVDYFYNRQDNFWRKEAMKKLPPLKHSTPMLICGEDLGMVPHCVPQVMKDLGILSLEIQRMPKDPNAEFFHPKNAPYLSVVTPSTHDMSTIRGWWEEDRSRTQKFYNYMLGHYGEAPHFCEAWICREIMLQHMYSPAMWSIFQLQDLFGTDQNLRVENPHDERINIPADPHHYWRYRIHISLEQLLKEDKFNDEISKGINESAR